MKRKLKIAIVGIGILGGMVGFHGCGTTVGNPVVTIGIDSYSPSAGGRELFPFSFLIPSAYASIGEVKLCFKRIRFKPDEKSTSEDVDADLDNLDFQIGEVTLSPGGTKLGSLVVPSGDYRRIEFDFKRDCSSGYSVQVTNGNGSFKTNETISVRFKGNFVVDSTDREITLKIQSILQQLENVTSDSEIKKKAEGAEGSF